MTKLRSQFFTQNQGSYWLPDGSIIAANSKGEVRRSVLDEFAKEAGISDTAERLHISAHQNRWQHKDIMAFIKDPDKCANPLKIASLVRSVLRSHVDFTRPEHADILALWIMGTYAYQLFNAYPYLHLHGPAGSGKTKVLSLLSELVFNPVFTGNISVAAMFRVVEGSAGTILFDEAEILGTDEGISYRLLLNSGYKKGAFVYRMERDGNGGFGLREFDTYGPKAIASIGKLPEVLASRCLHIPMLPSETEAANQLIDLDGHAFALLRNMLYRFGLMFFGQISSAYWQGAGIKNLSGRQRELWAPLKAIECVIKVEASDRSIKKGGQQ